MFVFSLAASANATTTHNTPARRVDHTHKKIDQRHTSDKQHSRSKANSRVIIIQGTGSMYSWNSIPKRWQLIFLLHTGFIIEYCLRVNASVAVVQMKEQYNWDDYERGLMLSSFYWYSWFSCIAACFLFYTLIDQSCVVLSNNLMMMWYCNNFYVPTMLITVGGILLVNFHPTTLCRGPEQPRWPLPVPFSSLLCWPFCSPSRRTFLFGLV